MRMQLSTWNSHSIQDTSYKATEPIGSANGIAPSTPNYIDMGAGDPILAGVTLSGTLYTFQVQLLGTTDATIESQRSTLNGWFRTNDTTPHLLVGLDVDNGNKDWYLEGVVISSPTLVPGAVKNLYNITLALTSPYWYEVDTNTNTWSVTSGTETEVMTNSGNMPSLPKFVITPVQAKGSNSFNYKTFYAIYDTSAYTSYNYVYNMPFNLTGSGLDTATLIGASKMQADGDDLQIIVDGSPVDRWFGGGGINSATTKVWINIFLTFAPIMYLKVALPNNGTVPATLQVTYTSPEFVSNLKQNSALLIGSEVITYSTYSNDTSTSTVTFVPTARNAKNSSYAAHSVNDRVYWIQHDVWLIYGNSAATARTQSTTAQPVLDLVNSTNASWVYSKFALDNAVASAYGTGQLGWYRRGRIKAGERYYGVHNATFAGTFDVVGSKINSDVSGNQVITDSTQQVGWKISHPGYISHILAAVSIYRTGTNMGYCKLEGVDSSILYWQTGDGIVAPAPPATASTWTDYTIDIDVTDNMIFYLWGGTYGLGTSFPAPETYAEIGSLTITIKYPLSVLALGVEQANYTINGTLENDTTGDTIKFNNLVTKIGESITIDCSTQEISSTDGKNLRSMIEFTGTKRDDWMTLVAGANSIIYTDTGTNEITIVTTWLGRNTI